MSPTYRFLRKVILMLGLATLLPGNPAFGIDFTELRPRTALQSGDQFGSAVAIGKNVIAVGAYLSDAGGKDSGAVYLFRKVGAAWEAFQAPLRSDSPGEWFGFDVAINQAGTLLVVGAPNPGKGTGAAYLCDVNAAAGTASCRPNALRDPQAQNAEIGSSVAIDDEWVAVGAREADQGAGRVYLFLHEKDTAPRQTLSPAVHVPGAGLGQSISLLGNWLAVGAPLKSKGAVYISKLQKENQTWSALDPMPVPVGLQAGAAFGYSVSIADADGSQPVVVVGAPLAAFGGSESGEVYLYSSGRTMPLRTGRKDDQLGVSVAADAEKVLVGARGADGHLGAAYLYYLNNGLWEVPLHPAARPAKAEFGFGVAARGSVLVAGAFKKGGVGGAYMFEQTVTLSFQKDEAPAASDETPPEPLEVEVDEGKDIPYSVVLATPGGLPLLAPVRATLEPGDGSATASDYASSGMNLDFEPGGSSSRRVPVSILSDCLDEEAETFTLTLTRPPGMEIVGPDKMNVTILDGDQEDGIDVTLLGGRALPEPPDPLVTNESDEEDGEKGVTLVLRLTCKPSADVTLALDKSGNGGEGKVSRSRIVFSKDKWEKVERVTVEGQDDAACDGSKSYSVDLAWTSLDSGYNGEMSIPFKNEDNDGPCSSASAEATASVCTEIDGTVVYTLEIRNTGTVALVDGPGLEILEPLPGEVTVVSADRGAATLDYVENEVAWNGSIPVRAAATIRIVAMLNGAEADVIFKGAYRNGDIVAKFDASFVVGETAPCIPRE